MYCSDTTHKCVCIRVLTMVIPVSAGYDRDPHGRQGSAAKQRHPAGVHAGGHAARSQGAFRHTVRQTNKLRYRTNRQAYVIWCVA